MGTQTLSSTGSHKRQGGPAKPAPFKLRSSCNACTQGKVGCTKEKPICARCARRGEACVYVAAKRVGRPACNKQPHKATQTVGDSGNAHASPRGSSSRSTVTSLPSAHRSFDVWAGDDAMDGSSNKFFPFTIPQPTMDSFLSDYTNIFADMLQPDDGMDGLMTPLPSFLPALSLSSNAVQDTERVIVPFSSSAEVLQTSSNEGYSHNGHCENDHGIDPAIMREHSTLARPVQSGSNSGISNFANPAFSNYISTNDGQSFSNTSPGTLNWFATDFSPKNSPPASQADAFMSGRDLSPKPTLHSSGTTSETCFIRAVGLLKQMSPQSRAESCTNCPDTSSDTGKRSFESVVAQNKEALNTISEILTCSCSKDASLGLVILVIYKVLGWYAACASAKQIHVQDVSNSDDSDGTKTPDRQVAISVQPPSREVMLRYGLLDEDEVEDQDRFVCRFVLSELHVTQRTVGLIAEQLRAAEQQSLGHTEPERHSLDSIRDLLFNNQINQIAGSGGTSGVIEANLRSHLRRLFRAIVEMLQRF